MTEILGYGEDAFTFWMLKKHLSEVLKLLGDRSKPSDCLVFFRPSFGRGGGNSVFGEFDAILASSENIYLIESKYDQFSSFKKDKLDLRGQELRHEIFSWYYKNWNAQQYTNWEDFRKALQGDFVKKFLSKKIAPTDSLLARNLEFVLRQLKEHSKEPQELKNVVIFFYGGPKAKKVEGIISDSIHFEVINIDYTQYKNDFKGNFIILD